MTETEYIKQLEERIEHLESIIRKITIAEGNNISFNSVSINYKGGYCSMRIIIDEFWMKAPNPMVTFFKTLDVTNLIKVKKRKKYEFHI